MAHSNFFFLLFLACFAVNDLAAQHNRLPARSTLRPTRTWGTRARPRVATSTLRPRRLNGTAVGRNTNNARNVGSNNNCEKIEVPMCKGLIEYTHTKLPNRFNHTTQLEVYRVLEHMWAMMDRGCSRNFRLLACSLYLPMCTGSNRPGREPCASTCWSTKEICEDRLLSFGYPWPTQFDCDALPTTQCIKMNAHEPCNRDYTLCEPLDLPMCQGLKVTMGMSPNLFGQCNRTEIATEMEQFRPLLASHCSPHLQFLLCGVYMPFCGRIPGLLLLPCQELCHGIRRDCEPEYTRLSGGLPWPNKFQCHRYPSGTSDNNTCIMPNEEAHFT